MHDPTEGGVATALWEMADAAGVGLAVEAERIPVLVEGAALCREFGLDPLGTIASGALLLALAPTDAGVLLHALAREGIGAALIGRVVAREAGVVLTRGGQPGPLPRFDQDEITRLFADRPGTATEAPAACPSPRRRSRARVVGEENRP
jgi:hydrogenase maturation factor